MFNLLQINVNRSPRAQDLAQATACARGADFIVISEPDLKVTKRRDAYCNKNVCACIVNVSKKFSVYKCGGGRCFAWILTNGCFIYSVYISPNCKFEEFISHLDALKDEITKNGGKSIVTGDFNAKNTYWGGRQTDRRGRTLLEWAYALELIILNDGIKPTLVRKNGVSYIDMTMVSPSLVPKVTNWEVLDVEALSDHRYVITNMKNTLPPREKRWILGKTDTVKYALLLSNRIKKEGQNKDVTTITKFMQESYREATPNTKTRKGQGAAYWWSAEISDLRRQCLMERRKYQRLAKRNQPCDIARETYRSTRKTLRQEISNAKRRKWTELCQNLENDPFGQGYKIVTNQLKMTYPTVELNTEERLKIFDELFMKPAEEDPPVSEKNTNTTTFQGGGDTGGLQKD